MKTYNLKLNKQFQSQEVWVEVNENDIKRLLKENPELLQEKPTHKRKYFVPKLLDTYYYIAMDGTTNNTSYSLSARFDKWNLLSGNCFATEQDAQDELNRRQALVRIWNNYDDKYSWDIDWEDSIIEKHIIGYNYKHKSFVKSRCFTENIVAGFELPYFKSAEDRNQFVEENRDDLLIIFNIK